MSENRPQESPDWRRQPSGLYVPVGVPEGGRRPVVGFAAALTAPKGPQPEEKP